MKIIPTFPEILVIGLESATPTTRATALGCKSKYQVFIPSSSLVRFLYFVGKVLSKFFYK